MKWPLNVIRNILVVVILLWLSFSVDSRPVSNHWANRLLLIDCAAGESQRDRKTLDEIRKIFNDDLGGNIVAQLQSPAACEPAKPIMEKCLKPLCLINVIKTTKYKDLGIDKRSFEALRFILKTLAQIEDTTFHFDKNTQIRLMFGFSREVPSRKSRLIKKMIEYNSHNFASLFMFRKGPVLKVFRVLTRRMTNTATEHSSTEAHGSTTVSETSSVTKTEETEKIDERKAWEARLQQLSRFILRMIKHGKHARAVYLMRMMKILRGEKSVKDDDSVLEMKMMKLLLEDQVLLMYLFKNLNISESSLSTTNETSAITSGGMSEPEFKLWSLLKKYMEGNAPGMKGSNISAANNSSGDGETIDFLMASLMKEYEELEASQSGESLLQGTGLGLSGQLGGFGAFEAACWCIMGKGRPVLINGLYSFSPANSTETETAKVVSSQAKGQEQAVISFGGRPIVVEGRASTSTDQENESTAFPGTVYQYENSIESASGKKNYVSGGGRPILVSYST